MHIEKNPAGAAPAGDRKDEWAAVRDEQVEIQGGDRGKELWLGTHDAMWTGAERGVTRQKTVRHRDRAYQREVGLPADFLPDGGAVADKENLFHAGVTRGGASRARSSGTEFHMRASITESPGSKT